jgi:hypothetical protein
MMVELVQDLLKGMVCPELVGIIPPLHILGGAI